MTRIAFLIGFFCASTTWVLAQGSSVEMTCPIDGKRFKFEGAPPASPNRVLNLDMKPAEPEIAPWPLPKCPENGFVIYQSKFSESKIRKFRQFVQSDAYRSIVDVHTTHYLAAVLRKRVEEPLYDIAWSLAQATWEVASDAVRYKQYAEEALAAYEQLPEGNALPRRQRVLKEMMSGELERRLGLFDAAKKRFIGIRDQAEFTTPTLQRVFQLQLKLISAKDTGIHRMPN